MKAQKLLKEVQELNLSQEDLQAMLAQMMQPSQPHPEPDASFPGSSQRGASCNKMAQNQFEEV